MTIASGIIGGAIFITGLYLLWYGIKDQWEALAMFGLMLMGLGIILPI